MDLLLKHSASLEAVTEVNIRKRNNVDDNRRHCSDCLMFFLGTVWPDALACGLIYGSSQHCKDPAAERSFPQCL